MLAAEGRPTDTAAIRTYQPAYLGRRTSDNCILELLPLPSPSTNHWVYSGHSALPQLKDRPSYRQHTTPPRIARLRELAVAQTRRVLELELAGGGAPVPCVYSWVPRCR